MLLGQADSLQQKEELERVLSAANFTLFLEAEMNAVAGGNLQVDRCPTSGG